MTALRHKLLEITNTPLQEHPARIEALRAEYEHSIKIVNSEHPVEKYTCGVYAFHLVEDPIYEEIASFGLGTTFAGAKFINFLLENKLLSPRDPSSLRPGDLIIYFDKGIFQHIGILKEDSLVLSKWGTGWLYEHGLLEVPLNYGNEVMYFIGPDKDASLDLFIKYAESRGFQFDG